MTDLTHKRFGRLTVIRQDGYHNYPSGKRKSQWLCRCDCGNYITVVISDLTNRHTQSCGCLRKDITASLKRSHNQSKSRLYRIWRGMKSRCYNAKQDNYQYYGMKNIGICNEWRCDFNSFYQWAMHNCYNDTLTLDRIDVARGYEPSNCRWVSTEIQALNRTDNRKIGFCDKSQTLKEWSREIDIPYSCLIYRLNHGWSVADALTLPSRKQKVDTI